MNVQTLFYLDITQDHINVGNPCDSGGCPITLAVMEALPQAMRIQTDGVATEFMLTRYEYKRLDLGKAGAQFVLCYDNGLPVEPTTIFLEELS